MLSAGQPKGNTMNENEIDSLNSTQNPLATTVDSTSKQRLRQKSRNQLSKPTLSPGLPTGDSTHANEIHLLTSTQNLLATTVESTSKQRLRQKSPN